MDAHCVLRMLRSGWLNRVRLPEAGDQWGDGRTSPTEDRPLLKMEWAVLRGSYQAVIIH